MYLQAKRRRGLGGLGIFPLSLATAQPSTPAQLIAAQNAASASEGQIAPVPDVSQLCSSWDFFFNPTAWQACAATAIAGGPQSVVVNAQTFGYPASVIDVGQAFADQQAALAPSDAANIANFMGAGSLLYDPTNQSALPTWAWIGLAIGAGLLVTSAFK